MGSAADRDAEIPVTEGRVEVAQLVGTGLERRVALDSKTVVVAEGAGIVASIIE